MLEFDVAYTQSVNTGKPRIFTFFKNEAIKTSTVTKDVKIMLDFKKKLRKLEHFYTDYENIEDLKLRFLEQLDKLLASQKI